MTTTNPTAVLFLSDALAWYQGLPADQAAAVDFALAMLREHGALLAMPHAHKVVGAKEPIIILRPATRAFALRLFYAFNPRREAIILLGDSKKGAADENTWTAAMAKRAGKLWDAYLRANGWRR